MGAGKSGNKEIKSTGGKVLDSQQESKMFQEMEKQYQFGLDYKKEGYKGSKRGLGA
ncbi:hypothetical protein K502DRAFT_324625 [Neoconidiobolus thromboides FSU 785]|nr:hypothetical protein K502DRAFT_324625 [Neoconidiobolus thromboides FSU 785]